MSSAQALMIGWWRVSRTTVVALVDAIRVSQWTKNLLLFAGLLFATEFDDPWRWVDAVLVFACYCAVSSAAYLVNDVHDAQEDRLHPKKRARPIASGRLGRRPALIAAGVLDALALAIAATLGLRTVVLIAAFLALQTVYTFVLKRLFLADVPTISGLFVIRASAGAAAVRVRISPWLLLCTALLALFLAFAKRRAELVLANARETPTRPVLAWYSTALLDRLLLATALSTIVAYSFYAFTARHTPEMALTIPFVVLGLVRYLFLVRARDLGEEPERVLLNDRVILATIGCWAVSAAAILGTS